MENKKLTTSLVASFLIATNLYSSELSSITVSSPSIETNEIDAAFATEIYTQKDIKKTNSKNVYEFLNSSSSIVTIPNSGNDLVHSIDMRGYGTTNGYKNIVVTVNGRRLNAIDSQPQLLSTININDIERIEIIKGGSSVEFGDGANAGSINIITKAKSDNKIKAYTGSNGTEYTFASFGIEQEKFIINGLVDYFKTDGSRSIDASNEKKDSKWSKNQSLSSIIFPTDNIELTIGKSFSEVYNNYSNSLTLEEYNNSIHDYGSKGSSSTAYISSDVFTSGVKYFFKNDYSVELNYNDENKLNENVTYSSKTDYDYKSYSGKLNYENNRLKVSLGIDGFDGDANGSTDLTTKDNKGVFLTANYQIDNMTSLILGGRYEKVEYLYTNTGANESYDKNLNAFEIGVNRKIDKNNSFYVNLNKSFQTPDIDMFFTYPAPTYTKTFNNFLKPAISKNINVGYNYFTDEYKLKLNTFYSKLNDEIYLYKDSGSSYFGDNTNLDKTEKYGFEVFNKYNFTNGIYTTLNYNYIIAKIVEEDSENGAYNGKYLPGVSKHNVTLGLGYTFDKYSIDLSHKYRSEAYAAQDFKNNLSQKQDEYNSTDLNLAYNYKDFDFFFKVNNLFDVKNGTWLTDDVITPVNFERTYTLGASYKF